MEYNELYHHGVPGMKWGVRRTPAQLGHKPSANSNKKTGPKANVKLSRKQKKAIEAQKEIKKKKAEDTASVEERKNQILKSRSAKALYENADLFTTNELQAAYSRLVLEKNIKDLSPKEISKGKMIANKAIETGDTISKLIGTGSTLYNRVALLNNAFNKSGKKMPIIGAKEQEKAKDKVKEEAEDFAKTASKTVTKEEKKENKKAAKEAKVHAKYMGKVEKTYEERTRDNDVIIINPKDVTINDPRVEKSVNTGRRYISGILEDNYR